MSSNTLIVPPPKTVDREIKKPLLCGPGPSDIWPSVAKALSKPVLTPICDEFFHVLDEVRAGLQYVFQTRSKLVLAMSGSGHSGMETIISNLVAPKETLLIGSRGIWDQRASILAKRYGIKTEMVSVPMNSTFTLEQLEPELKRLRPAALFITHGDSSTGTVQNLQGLGDLCHKYGTLLLLDTVVSLAGVPFFMDEWGVDGVYTSTQKVFSGPAGITPVAFSARAEEKINNRSHDPPFYFDVKLLAQQWNCYGSTRSYHHTMSPPLLWALRCCLQEIAKETLPVSWARHTAVTARFHKRLREYGFEFLVPKPEDRLTTVTTVVLPKGYDYVEFVKYMRAKQCIIKSQRVTTPFSPVYLGQSALFEFSPIFMAGLKFARDAELIAKHNILIFAGLGPTVGKALRIGIMGVNSTPQVADAVADAMADTLRALKKSSL